MRYRESVRALVVARTLHAMRPNETFLRPEANGGPESAGFEYRAMRYSKRRQHTSRQSTIAAAANQRLPRRAVAAE
jgi:hypothetical protein